MLDLFSDTPPWQEPLAPGAVVLRRFARERAPALLQAIADVASQSPFRQMVTPGRVHHVGRHDQLRRAGLDYRSPRLFVRPGRPGNRSNLAADACRIS